MLGRLRDYPQDLDAILMAKPPTMTIHSCAMWQDHMGRSIVKGSAQSSALADSNCDVEEAQDAGFPSFLLVTFVCGWQEQLSQAEYNVVCAALTHDYKEAVNFNLRSNQTNTWLELLG